MRYLVALADSPGDASYRTYGQRQADAIWQNDRDSLNRLGERWAVGGARDLQALRGTLGALVAATPAG